MAKIALLTILALLAAVSSAKGALHYHPNLMADRSGNGDTQANGLISLLRKLISTEKREETSQDAVIELLSINNFISEFILFY